MEGTHQDPDAGDSAQGELAGDPGRPSCLKGDSQDSSSILCFGFKESLLLAIIYKMN